MSQPEQTHLNEQQAALMVQREIRKIEDDLVVMIQTALDDCTYGKTNKDELQESQFRNLIQVAASTESTEVIKNFLRYQTGRDKKWGRGKGSLAEQIILHIDNELSDIAIGVAKAAESDDYKRIWIDLIRRYLGYGVRYLKYLTALRETA